MTYQVKIKSKQKIKATVASGTVMARNLNELLDVDVSGVRDKYVIMYDSSTQKYVAVNPDEVLLAAASTEQTSPGLPDGFTGQISYDGGSF